MKLGWISLLFAFFSSLVLPLAAIAGPTPGSADVDSDGVENAFDNCLSMGNPNQKDSDHDGCGNRCDGDFDQNGGTGLSDWGILLGAFGHTITSPGYKASVDMECNGAIGLPTYGLFLNEFGTTAGPSGISHPGRNLVACP